MPVMLPMQQMTSEESERELQVIESIAQARVKYENIMNEQWSELQMDLEQFHTAVNKYNETSLVAKLGQSWVPAQDMVDDYLAKCDDELCQVPKTLDELSLSNSKGLSTL
jgi:hypothetical protein